jgi:hypothetical protein
VPVARLRLVLPAWDLLGEWFGEDALVERVLALAASARRGERADRDVWPRDNQEICDGRVSGVADAQLT